MKYDKLHIVWFVLVAPVFATAPVVGAFGKGQWRGELYEVGPSSSHVATGRWDMEMANAPLSVPNAVAVARRSLRQLAGESQSYFECDEVKISRSNGCCFYVVTFLSLDTKVATPSKEGVFPAILPFIVYGDGTVEMPYKVNRTIQPKHGEDQRAK